MEPAGESRLRLLEEWFSRAMDTDAGQRPEVLAAAPAGIAGDLRALVDAADGAEAALESPRWGAGTGGSTAWSWMSPGHGGHSAPGVEPGTEADGFVFGEPIGAGGSGRVYRAVQIRPRREVAIKVLTQAIESATARRRFEREGELLGRLDHPGIATVFQVGVIDRAGVALPYIAMELVNGAPITRWVAGEAPAAPAAEPRRSARGRLALMADVCDAVQHAHSRGVLHRDLKPANVLVDADGRPRLVDFGVARPLDTGPGAGGEFPTVQRDLAGTFTHMAPELLDASIEDTRSDVYALGVIAWEVVAGRYPFATRPCSFAEAVALARSHAPPDVRGLRERLGSDAVTVLLKAVARNPDDRYQSAGEFGADLRRLAAGLPVAAKVPTLGYVAARFARRHPVLSASAAGAVALIVGLSALVVARDLAARRENARALEATRLAERRLAEQRTFVSQTLVRAAIRLHGVPGAAQVNAALIRDAVVTLEALSADAGDDVGLLSDLSTVTMQLASVSGGLHTSNVGDPDAAETLMNRAVALAQRALDIAPDHPDALAAMDMAVWGLAGIPSGASSKGEHYRRCVELRTKVYEARGRSDTDAFMLAYRLLALGGQENDLHALERAQALYDELRRKSPNDWEYRTAAGMCAGAMADVLLAQDPRAALAAADRATRMLSESLSERPDSYSCARHLAECLRRRGHASVRAGDVERAMADLREALALSSRYARVPTDSLHVRDRALLCAAIADIVHEALAALPADSAHRPGAVAAGVAALEMITIEPARPGAPWPEAVSPRRDELERRLRDWKGADSG